MFQGKYSEAIAISQKTAFLKIGKAYFIVLIAIPWQMAIPLASVKTQQKIAARIKKLEQELAAKGIDISKDEIFFTQLFLQSE